MTINKFLCKYFDRNNNGYVTINDIVAKIFGYIFLPIFVVYLDIRGILFLLNDNYNKPEQDFLGFFGVFVLALSVLCIWVNIADIKVAKCERINK